MAKSRPGLLSTVKLLNDADMRAVVAALALPRGSDRLDLLYHCMVSRRTRRALRAYLFSSQRCITPPPGACRSAARDPPATPVAAAALPKCKRHLDFNGL